MRFYTDETGRRLPRLPRRAARMETSRRQRALGLVDDVLHGAVGGASDVEICDRLVRRGYDAAEVLDLLDELRAEGRLSLQGGLWRRREGPPPEQGEF